MTLVSPSSNSRSFSNYLAIPAVEVGLRHLASVGIETSQERISLSTGCFCNPGAGEAAEGITDSGVAAATGDTAEMTMGEVSFAIESCRVIRDGS